MAKLKASSYRGPNSRKMNKAKKLEKAKRNETRQKNNMKKTALRNEMKKFNKAYKLQKQNLKNERLKINKVADNIRAVGAAAAENIIPSVTAITASDTIGRSSDNDIRRHQIDQLINSGVNKAGTDNEEEAASNKDFIWR